MERQVCNICGEEFDMGYEQEKFGLHHKIRLHYNGVHDGKYDMIKVDLNMCCNCSDELLDYILSQCKINPLADITFVRHQPLHVIKRS